MRHFGKRNDRRHGPDVAQLPLAISIPDLNRQVKERLPADTPVPSEAWVRFQFWPRNQFSETAKRYKCRFDVKYKVQRRQLRKTHIDAHYCAVLFRYLKEMAVRFRKHAALFFLDDKSKIPIGMLNVCVCVCVCMCVCVCVCVHICQCLALEPKFVCLSNRVWLRSVNSWQNNT